MGLVALRRHDCCLRFSSSRFPVQRKLHDIGSVSRLTPAFAEMDRVAIEVGPFTRSPFEAFDNVTRNTRP